MRKIRQTVTGNEQETEKRQDDKMKERRIRERDSRKRRKRYNQEEAMTPFESLPILLTI